MAQRRGNGCNGLLDRFMEVMNVFNFRLLLLLKAIAVQSAKHPLWIVMIISLMSVGLFVAGLYTNFFFETNSVALWVPLGSYPLQHFDWISDESGFPQQERVFQFLIHRKDYESVLEVAAVERVFDVMETITGTAGFEDVCLLLDSGRCREVSVASLWSGHREAFEETVAEGGLDAVVDVLSQTQFPTGERFTRSTIMGSPEPPLTGNKTIIASLTPEERRLTSALSFQGFVFLPPSASDSKIFEKDALDRIFRLRDEWIADESDPYALEVYTSRSFDDEISRSVANDIPLVGVAFVVMCVFCCIYFFKADLVRSQCLLGVGAVVSILLALAASYGLMFCLGVPFTAMTQVFPFILFGVGLDDAFVITGSFLHTDRNKVFHERIGDVMLESGITITVTTLTTFCAFMLGSITTLPSIRWFCWYAAAAIMVDYLYQITFFVALMALDHQRSTANRYDVIPCFKTRRQNYSRKTDEEDDDVDTEKTLIESLMVKYASFLLLPRTKAVVIVIFTCLLGVGGWLASHVTQDFKVLDLMPSDSYVASYFGAFDTTSSPESDRFMEGTIYFRDVDFSKPEIQNAMRDYVKEIVDLKYVTYPPEFFWLDDFDTFVSAENNTIETNVTGLSFEDQVAIFLETEPYKGLYKRDIVLNDSGIITASRTRFTFDNVDRYNVKEQTDALRSERAVTQAQSINEGKRDWPFFTISEQYDLWEFYSAIVDELIVTTCVTLAAVAVVALLFIRHPAGSLFVTPAVAMVYLELIGVIYVAGLHIDPMTSVSLVMSIGLAIDFCVHLVCKYFELDGDDRNAKVTKALRTLGSSVFLGGFSTFLGTLPLSLGSSQILRTFFVTFLGIVILGLGHGLVLMPVVLSIIGPNRGNGKLNLSIKTEFAESSGRDGKAEE